MSSYYQELGALFSERFGSSVRSVKVALGELTVEVASVDLTKICTALRDEEAFRFDQLIDLCGVDYSEHASHTGPRFGVVYHLLSLSLNHRIRLRTFAEGEIPTVDSVVPIWNCANWFEREAFDLFGIVFEGHPDLRRILTDYGFIGHPFRKDFPLTGQVEMRYDPEKGRVVYEPVSVENRVLVPRVVRRDHRYSAEG